MMKNARALLKVRNLFKYYHEGGTLGKNRRIQAVDGISFDLFEGECLGVVGESGCGKSTLSRLLIRLENSDRGEIIYSGEDAAALRGEELRNWRRNVQMIFQDAFASLNPRMRVEEIVSDPLRNFSREKIGDIFRRVDELLEMVGLDPKVRLRYPHEFSGGQRQRIAIARALVLEPRLLICDECVANLDVSVQAQILHLIQSLKESLGLSLIFISHDLSVVRYISDRIGVMYLGRMVEVLEADTLVEEALHPYTRFLLSSVPVPDPSRKSSGQALLQGEPPNPVNPPSGCRFHPRCPEALEKCRREEPLAKQISGSHQVVCHLVSTKKQ